MFFKKATKNLPDYWRDYVASLSGILDNTLADTTYVALDTETSGFDYEKDRILSIGWISLKNRKIEASSAHELFIDATHYDKKTVEIHGILKESSQEKLEELTVLKRLLADLSGAVILAHHAFFDIKMISEALGRHGLPKLQNPYIDTAFLYRLLPKTKQKIETHVTLDDLIQQFGIDAHDRHTALGDAYITAIAFLKMMSIIKPTSLKKISKSGGFWNRYRLF